MATTTTTTDDEDIPLETYPDLNARRVSHFLSKKLLLKSFYLHFFVIFLIPILNLIVMIPSPKDYILPPLISWQTLGVSAVNSFLIFKSYEDINHPSVYEKKALIPVSDLAEIFEGFSIYSFPVLAIDIYLIFHITPDCWPSIELFLSLDIFNDQLNADLIYLYLFELIRIIVVMVGLNYQRDIRIQILNRNSYILRKVRELGLNFKQNSRLN